MQGLLPQPSVQAGPLSISSDCWDVYWYVVHGPSGKEGAHSPLSSSILMPMAMTWVFLQTLHLNPGSNLFEDRESSLYGDPQLKGNQFL